MAKIDDYKKAQARAKRFRDFLTDCSRGDCDKFGATVKLIDTYKGYYGNSSCSSWCDEIIAAVTVEIQNNLRLLIKRATERAEREAEAARKAAVDEAREVLAEVSPA